jgi:hypothetical protein
MASLTLLGGWIVNQWLVVYLRVTSLLTDIGCYQVSYLREIRGGGVSSGYVATGFWGGEYRQYLSSAAVHHAHVIAGNARIDRWSSYLRATQQEGE